jgi:hypothetical protein
MPDENNPIEGGNGWEQWTRAAQRSMDTLEKKVEKLDERIIKHREESLVEISTLKAKAGIMGMIAGFIVSTVMSIIIGLLVWNLTVGRVVDKHPHPTVPEQSIGYVLPPRENAHIYNISEAKT